MREDQKKDVALFRYSIISELVNANHLSICAQYWK